MEKAYIYLVLGCAQSGRLEVVSNLVRNGFDVADRVVIYRSGVEVSDGDEASGVRLWEMREGRIVCEVPKNDEVAFFIADGCANPVDQVEAFRDWLDGATCELGGVITVVHCALALQHPELIRWYDACIHFSDTVLLNRRENVPQTWIREFIDRYVQGGCYPCYIEQLKHNRISKPAEVLDTCPRRISLIFEPQEDFEDTSEPDDENFPEEPFDLTGKPDPYLERLPGGQRAKVLPDIKRFLDADC